MDEGDGGDRHEAISAVADEGFLGEEDDDYEDLYNDVNVGEGFLQTLRVNNNNNNNNNKETLAYRNNNNNNNDIESVVESTVVSVSIPGVGGELKVEKDMGGVGGGLRMEGHQELGFRGSGVVHGGGGGGGGGMRVELGQSSVKAVEVERIERQVSVVQDNMGAQQQLGQLQQQNHGVGNEGYGRQGGGGGGGGVGGGVSIVGSGGGGNVGGGHGVVGNVSINGVGVGVGVGGGGGGTILFVGDLHWWTTDAQLESELCKYGSVKEVKFFDEKASGKSKGYCQVEFYDPAAAAACKEGMNGHLFNGRPCVVAFASPYSVRRMGEAQVNKNQAAAQASMGQGKQVGVDAVGRGRGNSIATGANYQGGDGNRGYGRGNWGRGGGGGGGQGMGGRGPVAPMRNRMGDMGGRGIMGNGGSGFGQGLAPTPTMMHPQSMMGQGFDPSYGAHMGRLGGYGGFLAAPAPPFTGMMPSFPPVGGVGLPGVAPHVNPAFFGRGMPGNGMGGMPTAGADGHGMGMWTDPNAAGWGNEDPGGRAGESSYGDDAASDHQYGEASHERGGRPGSVKDKERTSERDWSGPPDRRYRDDREPASEREMPREKDVGRDHDWSEKRHRDDREPGRERDRERERDRDRERDRERDRYKEERDRYSDHHRHRERGLDYENDWERGRAPSSHKSRYEEHRRSRSRDVDYGVILRLLTSKSSCFSIGYKDYLRASGVRELRELSICRRQPTKTLRAWNFYLCSNSCSTGVHSFFVNFSCFDFGCHFKYPKKKKTNCSVSAYERLGPFEKGKCSGFMEEYALV